MCGIVGYITKDKKNINILIDGLKKLEYRGYDSSGIAYIKDNKVVIKKKEGKISNLEKDIDLNTESVIGIGHTRWATHGVSNSTNAHPHKVGKFTVVHNGIIENYVEIKNDLISKGYTFKSDTDTEVIPALLDYLYKSDNNILNCINKLNSILVGSYALGVICDDDKTKLYTIKNKSPLIIGIGKDTNFIASDVPAILDKTSNYVVLNDTDYACIESDKITVYNNGKEKNFETKEFQYNIEDIDKQGYEHFMLKEIHEEPNVFKKTTENYLKDDIDSLINKLPDLTSYSKIRIVACGSAMHAGLIGKNLIERFADVPVDVEIASEFRYSKQFLNKDELVILISQSGETADTLAALNIAKENGCDTLGIINEKGSTIARESKIVLYTEAGKEIAVATTKAYFAQVTLLALIALNLANTKNLINKEEIKNVLNDIKVMPVYIQNLIENEEQYLDIAKYVKDYNDVFFIGRGVDYALSLEGSLKLKEISYTHSEAYAAGELKHGTISLIEGGTPVFAIVTDEKLSPKTISNIKEVKSRGANVIYITNNEDISDKFYDNVIKLPKVSDLFEPLLAVIPLQLIAYNVAKLKECDIDKPRNLAKSVTVE